MSSPKIGLRSFNPLGRQPVFSCTLAVELPVVNVVVASNARIFPTTFDSSFLLKIVSFNMNQKNCLRSGLSITPAVAPLVRTFKSFPKLGMVLCGTIFEFQSGKACPAFSGSMFIKKVIWQFSFSVLDWQFKFFMIMVWLMSRLSMTEPSVVFKQRGSAKWFRSNHVQSWLYIMPFGLHQGQQELWRDATRTHSKIV